MKKLLVLLSSLFIFAGLFTGCPKEAPQTTLTEEEEYTNFYNKIAAHTWVCATLNSPAFSEYSEARLEKYGTGDSEDISLYGKLKNDNSVQRIGSVLNKKDSSVIKINSSEWKRITTDQTFIVKIISNNTINVIITFEDNTIELNFTMI